MKIKLHHVHLRNFRIHEDYLFEPAETGVTAIVGKNGQGKSSIIDGVAWALYGTKPNTNMKNSSWRRMQAPEDDPSFVSVELEVNDQVITIKRSIVNAKNGGQQCECFVGDELVAGPAVTHAEKWIVQTIGLDENSFLSTILVQQKHVDELVSAGQAERRRLLERLTGIEAVSRAWARAKDEAKSYAKAAEVYGVDDDQLEDTQKQLTENTKKLQDTSKSLAILRDKQQKLDAEGRSLKHEVKQLESTEKSTRELSSKIKTLEAESSILQDRMKELTARRSDLKQRLPRQIASSEDIASMKKQLSKQSKQQDSLRMKIARLDTVIAMRPSSDEQDILNKNIHDTQLAIDAIDRDSAVLDLDKLRQRIALDQASMSQIEDSLRTFDNHGIQECPTCLQPIHDQDHVRKELQSRFDTAKQDSKQANPLVKHCEEVISSYQQQSDTMQRLLDNQNRNADKIASANEAMNERITVQADLDGLDAKIEALRKTMNRFDADAVKLREYERVRDDLAKTMERSTTVDVSLSSARKDLKAASSNFSEKKLEKLRSELDAKRSQRDDLHVSIAETQSSEKILSNQIASDKKIITMITQQREAKHDLLSKLEISSGSVEVLGTFRSHMILSAIPQITDYASDLLSTITDGKFVSVTIDHKFMINVEDEHGLVENSGQLSGGEMSLVAICLRLAISVMLSNGSPSLLVLDEILTAMDEDRASEILEAMQSLSTDSQIIIVAHNEIIKSIADKVVSL
jgi:exonuclease SbcC